MPKKNQRRAARAAAVKAPRVQAVDVITGKQTVEYLFDPSLLIKTDNGEKVPVSQQDPLFFQSKHLFMPCTIIKALLPEGSTATSTQNSLPYPGPTLVKMQDGTLHKINDSTRLIPMQSPDDYVGCNDVLNLPSISEASLLHTLRTRFQRNQIYTAAGPILLSINPYEVLMDSEHGTTIYSEEYMLQYRCGTTTHFTEAPPPHLFLTAHRAYTAMMESTHSTTTSSQLLLDGNNDPTMDTIIAQSQNRPRRAVCNQSIIISGESGAGKTEATKQIMRFLARSTRKTERSNVHNGHGVAALEDRVLSSNPLLETFGNAQTLRNDNSSRFGKYIHIFFNTTTGSITGASISKYLLEKTRITHQVEGERNYHIFYQLLSGADEALLKELGLDGGSTDFFYLGCRDAIATEKDSNDFLETKKCLTSIGLSEDEQTTVFGMAAAVLHLGNIQFEPKEEDHEIARITNDTMASLKKACDLLGFSDKLLSEAILTKTIIVSGKSIKQQQSVALAEDKRDALAKMTYGSLFRWLVSRVNESLKEQSDGKQKPMEMDDHGFIGVLDIYGFECFNVNGFEQLLINYCNEKLQRHFNRHIFEVEQQLYAVEGVDWSYITFNDNRPCLELIEGGSGIVGILNTLDDAWGGIGPASEKDSKFVIQLQSLFGSSGKTSNLTDVSESSFNYTAGHENFRSPTRARDRQFAILHYAGEVTYNATGFVEKNVETLSNELRDLGSKSSQELSRKVYAYSPGATSTQRSSIRGVSVGSQFRNSLQALVADLDKTQPHYIRCIKPNVTKAANTFLSGEVLKQLQYSGMMEAIRIRSEGYALREEHESFYHRFRVLVGDSDMNGDETVDQLVKALSQRLGVTEVDWQIGHSKVFLRRQLADKLDRLSKLRVRVAARTIGRFSRHVVHRSCSTFLVCWVKFRLHMLKLNRLHREATKISSVVRCHNQRIMYVTVRRGFILLQAVQRQKAALLRVNRIRDPFFDVSFQDCMRLLQTEQRRLEDAVAAKDFKVAAEHELKIEALTIAIESKKPLTRAVLESRILELHRKLDDAVLRHAFSECGTLQDELDDLIAKRVELPTIQELQELIQSLEVEIALAAKIRDFPGAALGQARLEETRNRLSDLMSEDGEANFIGDNIAGVGSRAELESEIFELSKQVKAALASKNYMQASSFQQLLDERESLRSYFPSIAELEQKIIIAKQDLESSIAKKDFAQAGRVQDSVSELEKILEAERLASSHYAIQKDEIAITVIGADGTHKSIETRGELENEIRQVSLLMENAVASRDFKKANELQTRVDALILYRTSLPSVAELQQKLNELRTAVKAAVSSKSFAEADELNKQAERLEQLLAKEKPSYGPLSVVSNPGNSLQKRVTSGVSTSSVRSRKGNGVPVEVHSLSTAKSVHKLRPARPVSLDGSTSITNSAIAMASKRVNAAVIIGPEGELCGIITDTDITRRAVANHKDTDQTSIQDIMTPNPTYVSLDDPAMDALITMIENHFRHLPVVDSNGSVVGLLDISKCLSEAIARLEKLADNDRESVNNAGEAVKRVIKQTPGDDSQTAVLQALLSKLMSNATGGQTIPTLRSILHGKPSTIVTPSSSIRNAGIVMGENRKAILVVEEGRLQGIFGFRDMVTRAVAKGLPLDLTPISKVMTAHPEYVSPDMTVLEALQSMADNNFTTLPVCENDGTVVGLVDVLDLIYGCGAGSEEGWRSIFTSAMDAGDDVSELGSVPDKTKIVSLPSNYVENKPILNTVAESVEERTVAKLRPPKSMFVAPDDAILRCCQAMTSKRKTSALIISSDGQLEGIFTDKDVTIRVIAKGIDPMVTPVAKVMTTGVSCVAASDPALDALIRMVENKFRHLPVIDHDGAVMGTLDISKCLSSIIHKLERLENATTSFDAAEELIKQVGVSGTQERMYEVLKLLLKNKATPTLRTLLHGKPSSIIPLSATIRDAAIVMAASGHAALVVDKERLVGLFGWRDARLAVGNEIPLDETLVADVMTSEPEFVSPELSALEALHILSDSQILSLPVCEADGTVLGVVDVMDIIGGCGSSKDWKPIFSKALEITDNTVADESVICRSPPKKLKEKTVAQLRPSKAHLSLPNESVLSVAQYLQRKRGSASLVVSLEGALAGIVTDTDFTRRVVAKYLDTEETMIEKVITYDPYCVSSDDSAIDALITMIENHFRHLPVVDSEGAVIGVLDIGKCLDDAIAQLEFSIGQKATDNALKSLDDGTEDGELQTLLAALFAQSVDEKPRTLRSILTGKPSTIVSPTTTIRVAGCLMAESRHAALVVDEGQLIGIFGFKDMMSRAIACQLPLDTTPIVDVMTPQPEFLSPDQTVLDALQTMYDSKCLTLPVCESDGSVVGSVDVFDVIFGCGGTAGWRSVFKSAMNTDETVSCEQPTKALEIVPRARVQLPGEHLNSSPNIPQTLILQDGGSFVGSGLDLFPSGHFTNTTEERTHGQTAELAVFKVTDASNGAHRVKCPTLIAKLVTMVSHRINVPEESIQLKYVDDDGDEVEITSNEDVAEAWALALQSGSKAVKLIVTTKGKRTNTLQRTVYGLGAAAAVSGIVYALFLTMNRKRS